MDRWLVERDLHCALNSFWGCPDPTLQEQHQADDRPAVSRILRGLANDVARLKEVKEVTESFDWGDFFRTRTLVLRAQQHNHTRDTEKCEIRKDKVLPAGPTVWRVYLDNYDLLEKYPRETLLEEGVDSAPEVEALRKEYLEWGLPRPLADRLWWRSRVRWWMADGGWHTLTAKNSPNTSPSRTS